MRACLAEEFNEIWCYDLRGDARTQGEQRKREGGNVFDAGSRAPIAITFLVRNPKKGCTIYYKDIGDYHDRKTKLGMIKNQTSIEDIGGWETIDPDPRYDWLDQRNDLFLKYMSIGNDDVKKGNSGNAVFNTYSSGVKTARDVWAYNSSKETVSKNMKKCIEWCLKQDPENPNMDSKQGKWDSVLSTKLTRSKKLRFYNERIRIALYRPFFKQYLYHDDIFNHVTLERYFPEEDSENLVICVPYKFKGEFSVFITNITPDIQLNFNGQCFPFYTYENGEQKENITDHAVKVFQNHYRNDDITKMQIFEYVYGLLHHAKYRTKYANNLMRELPRIPMAPDFWAFRNAGRELMDLHLHYETGTMHDLGQPKHAPKAFTRIAFGREGTKTIKSTICDAKTVVFDNIPDIKYRVNGRTPVEWMVDRYNKKQDKDSGITNYPLEHMTGKDVIDLLRRLVHVGVDSDRIISRLPQEFEPKHWKPVRTGMDRFVEGTGSQGGPA